MFRLFWVYAKMYHILVAMCVIMEDEEGCPACRNIDVERAGFVEGENGSVNSRQRYRLTGMLRCNLTLLAAN